MRILGIDPGLCITGWAMLHLGKKEVQILATGLIKPPPKNLTSSRIQFLYREVSKLSLHEPSLVALEEGYCGVDARSALKLGMVRGAIFAALATLSFRTYAPSYIKREVVGKGNASKEEMMETIRNKFPLLDIKQQDIADAISVGLCAISTEKLEFEAAC